MNIRNEKNSESLKIFIEIGGEEKVFEINSQDVNNLTSIEMFCITKTDEARRELKHLSLTSDKRARIMNHIVGSIKDYHRTLTSAMEYAKM